MSRLITTGFESGAASAEPAYNGGGATVQSTVKRSGTYALKAGPSVESAGLQNWTGLSPSTAGYFVRFYLYIETMPSSGHCCIFKGPNGTVDLHTDGKLYLSYWTFGPVANLVSGSSSTLATLQWYRVEASWNDTAHTVELLLDGTSQVSASGFGAFFDNQGHIELGNVVTSFGEFGDAVVYFDDVACNIAGADSQGGYPGAGSVANLYPTGDGDAATGSPTRGGTDSGANWSQVDEAVQNGATDYVILPVNPSDFWVNVQDGAAVGIGTGDAITLVEVHAQIAGASGTAANWLPQIQSQAAGTKVAGTTVTLASASFFIDDDTAGIGGSKLVQLTDPQNSSNPWTPALVNSMQISAKTTDGNPDTYVSALWAIVEYVPGVPIVLANANRVLHRPFTSKPGASRFR